MPAEGQIEPFDAGWNAHRVGIERKTVAVISSDSRWAVMGWDCRELISKKEAEKAREAIEKAPESENDPLAALDFIATATFGLAHQGDETNEGWRHRADCKVCAKLAVVRAALEKQAEMEAALRAYDEWASQMPDAGFNANDPRWNWWHVRPSELARAALAVSPVSQPADPPESR